MLGNKTPVDLPAFCRVAGVLKPTSDSDIKFEVWMPAAGWNGKFQDVGNGGFAGLVAYRSMAGMLKRGYATASTDDGHTGGADVSWAIGHPEKVIDFGYRAVHETARVSKSIIHAYYGKDTGQSYFNGCSDGGREALMEAQRFPDDFDGIIVGAPANSWTHQFAGFVWNEQATLSDPASYIPPTKLPALQAAALAQCKNLDGAEEGILEDPSQCHFDPAVIQCTGGDGPNCLTAPQVVAAQRIYAGPRNPRTGKQIYPGYQPGAEAWPFNWSAWITGAAPGQAIQFFFGNTFFADMMFQNPKWDFRTLNFDHDISLTDEKLGAILNSNDPDLRPFQSHGGKMIQYHGWVDAAVAPTDSIDYYNSVVSLMAGKVRRKAERKAFERVQTFYRLFMVPGMEHCSGGPGANDFGNRPDMATPQLDPEHDVVSALDRWVVQGVAPDKLVATKYADDNAAKGIIRTHLLCPYPQVAQWTGKGSRSDAANFACGLAGQQSPNRVAAGKKKSPK
jgi:feruloyl esterase